MASKVTHCKICNASKDEKFRGKLCHDCYLKNQNEYYRQNKEKVIAKQKEIYLRKRLQEDPTYIPFKDRKFKLSDEERIAKRRRYEERKRKNHAKREALRYHIKQALREQRRKPLRKNTDRESYCDNATWGIDHFMHLNVDTLKYCPLEQLTIEYWEQKEYDEQQYYKDLSKSTGARYVIPKGNASYLRGDNELPEDDKDN